jgi:hypothetical protein
MRTASELHKHYRQLQGHQLVDLLCILEDGLIVLDTVYEGFEIVDRDFSERCMLAHVQFDVSVLLWFFITLLNILESQPETKPVYQRYLHAVEGIGLVRKVGIIND